MFDPAVARQQMVDSQLRARGISDERVLAAMSRVPRHEFVPENVREQAYEDHPLPIGEGQTISQPYVVALMLEALQLSANDRVLDVGAGSGYAAAVLAELVGQVFAIERHSVLAENARGVLRALGYSNVQLVTGDGSEGLREHAPYDAILVSAAALEIPSALVGQLRERGRMIIPAGAPDSQQLQFVRRVEGKPVISTRGDVRFVPLVSERR